jgi:hypothetical protein
MLQLVDDLMASPAVAHVDECKVSVAMRVDATVIPCAASTMVMVIPSLKVFRDGTAVPDRSDGWSGLFLQPWPITPTLRRDVPSFNVPLVGLGRRRLATSRDSKPGRTCQHSRSYLGPAINRCPGACEDA